MDKIRVITADEVAERLNKTVGETQIGKVLWYDKSKADGVILGDDGNEYLFSMGRPGHIGVSKPNYVVNSTGYVFEDQIVRFEPVDTIACNIRDFLDKHPEMDYLKNRLSKIVQFNENAAIRACDNDSSGEILDHESFQRGARFEHARLQPVLKCLLTFSSLTAQAIFEKRVTMRREIAEAYESLEIVIEEFGKQK